MIALKEVKANDLLAAAGGHCTAKMTSCSDGKKDLGGRPVGRSCDRFAMSSQENHKKTNGETANEPDESVQVDEESTGKARPPAEGATQVALRPLHSKQQQPDRKLELILNPSEVFGHVCVLANQTQQQQQQQQQQLNSKNGHQLASFISGPPYCEIKATRKRYFILFMFSILQITKSFQWICLGSITNVVAKFYQVDNLAINWTTILFMVTFLVLALPVSCIMDSIGLRRSVLIGTLGVTVGACIKCCSCHRDGFATSMWGHLIVGLSEPFFFSSYAQLSSIWFPDNQVALATAISIIGEQTGMALGFIVPPWMIGQDPNDFGAIQRGLFQLSAFVALVCVLNTISIVLFFDEEPRLAPGVARFKQKQDETSRRLSLGLEFDRKKRQQRRRRSGSGLSRRISQSVSEQMKLSAKFLSNKHFILLLVGFGICEGICYSIHTLLNQMIVQASREVPTLTAHPVGGQSGGANSTDRIGPLSLAPQQEPTANDSAADDANQVVGNTGLILIVSGLIGSALCGFVLDKYHRHKLTAVAIYLLALLSMVALSSCFLLENTLLLYLASIPLGFAQTGYASCAFDFGVELTYPKPELLSSILLNMSAQVFGIPISLVGSVIVDTYGSLALGCFFCSCLVFGFLATCLQGGELRRRNAVLESHAQANCPPQQQQQQQQLTGKSLTLSITDKLESWQANQKTVL